MTTVFKGAVADARDVYILCVLIYIFNAKYIKRYYFPELYVYDIDMIQT